MTLRCLFLLFSLSYTNILFGQNINWNNQPAKGFVYQISNKESKKLLSKNVSNKKFQNMLHSMIDSFHVDSSWIRKPEQGHFILASIEGNQLKCRYTAAIPYQVFLMKEYEALSLQVLDSNGVLRKNAKVKLNWQRINLDKETNTYRIEHNYFNGETKTISVELDGFLSIFEVNKHGVPYYHNYSNYDSGPDFYSYIITDKNKYRPNEKIRFKSYALSNSRSPIRKNLNLYLNAGKSKKLLEIEPHRPGSFTGEFMIHDSLNLKLDRHYQLQLRNKRGRIVSSTSFQYEDYELFGNKLKIELTHKNHYFPNDNILSIIATDINDLLLKDAKAQLLVKPIRINKTFEELTTLPDTLMYKVIELDSKKPTQIDIPSNWFNESNTSYKITVSVLNSENERIEESVIANYFLDKYEIKSRLSADSICFSLFANGNEVVNTPAQLSELFKNSKSIVLPYKEKLNAGISQYEISHDKITESIVMRELIPELDLMGGIEADSFKIELINSQKVEVSWFIYRGSILVEKGSGLDWSHSSIIEDRSMTYYVELLYNFGGKEQIKKFQYDFKSNFLDISLDIPDKVYPSQTVEAKVSVKNEQGDPVRGVDLTALATNRKLNHYIPDLPYYGNTSKARPKKAHYDKNLLDHHVRYLQLDYEKWNPHLRLDTMKYYQFTYPNKEPFRYSYPIEDSTQFSVYLMKNGFAEEIHVIEVDHEPVYFSWTDRPERYSFYIPGDSAVLLSVRTDNYVFEIDSFRVKKDSKSIISYNLDSLIRYERTTPLTNQLTSREKSRYLKYQALFSSKQHTSYAYLESNKQFTPVFGRKYNARNLKVGPIIQERKTYIARMRAPVNYNYKGGFQYSFEENIVYKQDYDSFYPFRLSSKYVDQLEGVNDLVWTKSNFLDFQRYTKEAEKWNPKNIDIVGPRMRLRIDMPYEKHKEGIASIMFKDMSSGDITAPCFQNGHMTGYLQIPVGSYEIIVLYTDGSYFKRDSIDIIENTQIVFNLHYSKKYDADVESLEWLKNRSWYYKNCFPTEKKIIKDKPLLYQAKAIYGNVKGVITDEYSEPLPGCTILIEGTNQGTVTDIDGEFTLDIDNQYGALLISFVGYVSQTIEVSRGSNLYVQLEPDVQALEEVVVVGYGTTLRQDLTAAMSGRVAGVSISSSDELDFQSETEEDIDAETNIEAENQLYQELTNLKSIRSNFSDVAFWQPRLFTDRKGEASFEITFPDNITQWDASILAMNRQLKTGTLRKSIKSYKPLLAELKTPRFLIIGDTANLVGKVSNYTKDSTIVGEISWSQDSIIQENKIEFEQFYGDYLKLSAENLDSVNLSFVFNRNDGYMDGEKRTIPVLPQGIDRATGDFFILGQEKSRDINAPVLNSTKTVDVFRSQLDFYESQMNYLINYRYACNEQLASKLIGLLNQKLLYQYEGRVFKKEQDIKKIIKRLLRNQNNEFLWSWWEDSDYSSYWISAHIIRALKMAQQLEYAVALDVANLTRKVTYKFDYLKSYSLRDVELINALAAWNAPLNYSKHITVLDTLIRHREVTQSKYLEKINHKSYLSEKLLLIETRQLVDLKYNTDTLLAYQKTDILGRAYFEDGKTKRNWYNNDFTINILAYRIAKNDSSLQYLIEHLQLYFLDNYKKNHWNTYQAANSVMTVMPDLLQGGMSYDENNKLLVIEKMDSSFYALPFKKELSYNENISLHNMSGQPLYCQEYTIETVTEASQDVEGFEISTFFENKPNFKLNAGEPIELIVKVKVNRSTATEHVMIEIPIPASCSYTDKNPDLLNRVESHREYYKDKTIVFCEEMDSGIYYFKVKLLPRFSGTYHLNPAQVSLMYVPVINANTAIKKVLID